MRNQSVIFLFGCIFLLACGGESPTQEAPEETTAVPTGADTPEPDASEGDASDLLTPYPGAEVEAESEAGVDRIRGETQDSAEKVLYFHRDRLEEEGWTITIERGDQGRELFVATRDGRSAFFAAENDGQKTVYHLVFSDE